MKSYFLWLFCIIPGVMWAQEISQSEVPSLVVKAFNKKFTATEVYGWSRDDNSLYIVDFVQDDLDYQACFNDKGVWEYSQFAVDESELPEKVADIIYETFSSPSIMQAELKETKDGRELYVLTIQDEMVNDENDEEDAALENYNSMFEVVINSEGQIIAKNSI